MPNKEDIEERKLTTRLLLIIAGAIISLGFIILFVVVPALVAMTEPGVSLRESAIYAFALTLVCLIIMAVVAGDGLIGEIQFMIAAFGGFFLISWFMIAWIF